MGYGGGYGRGYGYGYGGGVDSAIAHPDVVNLPGVVNAYATSEDDLAKMQMEQQTAKEAQTLEPFRMQQAQAQAQAAQQQAQQQTQEYNEWRLSDAFKDFDPNAADAAADWAKRIAAQTAAGNPLAAQWQTYNGEYGFRRMMGVYGNSKAPEVNQYAAGATGSDTAPTADQFSDQDYLEAQGRTNPDKLRLWDKTAVTATAALEKVLSYGGGDWRDEWRRQATALGRPDWAANPPASIDDVESILAKIKGQHQAIQGVMTRLDIGGELPPEKEQIKDVGGTAYAYRYDPLKGTSTMTPITQDLESIGTLPDGREVFMDKHGAGISISPMPLGPKVGTAGEAKPMSPSAAYVQAQRMVDAQENRLTMGGIKDLPKDYDHNKAVDDMFNAITSAGTANAAAPAAAPSAPDKHQLAATYFAQAKDTAAQAARIADPNLRRQKLNEVKARWAQVWKQNGFQGQMPPLPNY